MDKEDLIQSGEDTLEALELAIETAKFYDEHELVRTMISVYNHIKLAMDTDVLETGYVEWHNKMCELEETMVLEMFTAENKLLNRTIH